MADVDPGASCTIIPDGAFSICAETSSPSSTLRLPKAIAATFHPKHVVVALLPAEGEVGELRLGIASDEVIGTYSTSDPLLVDEAPQDVPHCCGHVAHRRPAGAGFGSEQVLDESFRCR